MLSDEQIALIHSLSVKRLEDLNDAITLGLLIKKSKGMESGPLSNEQMALISSMSIKQLEELDEAIGLAILIKKTADEEDEGDETAIGSASGKMP